MMNRKVLFWPFLRSFGSGGSGGSSDGTIRLTAAPDWDSVNGYTF